MADSSEPSASFGTPFKPGQSGNPGGKNPEREALRRLIAESYGREAIEGIAKLSKHAASEKVQLSALIWLAEQTVGKAVIAVSGEDGGPVRVDVASIVSVLSKLAGDGAG